MATLGDILQAKQPDVWAQLAGIGAPPTPGPVVDTSAPAVASAARAMPSPAPQIAAPNPLAGLRGPNAQDEATLEAAIGDAAREAKRNTMWRRVAANFSQGAQNENRLDLSDIEAARKAPLEAYARREAARNAANKAIMDQISGAHQIAETSDIPLKRAQEAASAADLERYRTGELGNTSARTAMEGKKGEQEIAARAREGSLNRGVDRERIAAGLTKDEADRLSREKIAASKLAALKNAQHNARASGLAGKAASLDAAIQDAEAQYKAAKDANRPAGMISGALEHIPLVGSALASIVAPGASAVRGGAQAENESAATAIGGGAATQVRMKAMEPLTMDPSLSKTALKNRYDIKKQRLGERRTALQNEAASLGIPLDPSHGQGAEAGGGATHYKYNADKSLRIPSDAAGNELGPPEPNR